MAVPGIRDAGYGAELGWVGGVRLEENQGVTSLGLRRR